MERVLIVDDEPDVLETLKYRFEHWGFEVTVAVDGLEALEKARSEQPDLIILDLMLPKMDGFQVCRLLKFDERHRNIPIVMLTAKTATTDRMAGEKTGADAYVTKPFKADELRQVAESALSVKRKSA